MPETQGHKIHMKIANTCVQQFLHIILESEAIDFIHYQRKPLIKKILYLSWETENDLSLVTYELSPLNNNLHTNLPFIRDYLQSSNHCMFEDNIVDH